MLEIYDELRAAGLAIWIDQRDIPKGAPWDQSITKALKASSVFVLIASQNSIESDNVADEVVLAKKRGMKLLFVLLEEIDDWKKLELHAARPQHILAYDEYRASLQDELLAAIRGAPVAEPGELRPSGTDKVKRARRRLRLRRDVLIGSAVTALLAATFVVLTRESWGAERPSLLVRLAAGRGLNDRYHGQILVFREDADGSQEIGRARLSDTKAAALFKNPDQPLPDLEPRLEAWTQEIQNSEEFGRDVDGFLPFWDPPISGPESVQLGEELESGANLRIEFWHTDQRIEGSEPQKRRSLTLTLTPGLNDCVLVDEGP